MKVIEINDENYPEKLREISKPPKKLYILGNEKILNETGIAIVGSRCCTEYGEKAASFFARELTKQEINVISGLAKGIDSCAHRGCLSQNGKTIAVLGCGFNKLFPKENKKLFDKIIDTGGAIISEYAPTMEPSSDKFRNRNRIVSGLSIATLIIEAAYRSGTTITARYTEEQGKPVFCIPNSLDNNKGVGTNELLKKGAILVTNVDDILINCNIPRIENVDKKINEKKKVKEKIKQEKLPIPKTIKINEKYKSIYNLLKDKPLNTNEICKKLNISISEVNSKLLFMEVDGLIKRIAGNQYIVI